MYALINSEGLVVNVILLDDETGYTPDEGLTLVATDVAGIGWTYLNGEFTAPVPIVPEPVPEPTVSRIVPKSIWLASLYPVETREFARLECISKALTVEDYAVSPQENMQTYMHTMWAAFLVHWNGLGNDIDLADANVIQGLNLFGGLCLPPLTNERIQEILDWELER
jgi:hypothetical protein